MSELITPQELSKIGISQQELIIKFNAQLIKDFETCGAKNYLMPITNFEYEHIHKHIFEALKLILIKIPQQYQQLLYIIDIPENKNTKLDEVDAISDLIIKRILQKVILKIIHSKK